jgi:hypothetical protein
MSKNNKNELTAAQLKSLPISIGEARKTLGTDVRVLNDDEVAQKVLSLNELATFLLNNIDLHKLHL